MADASPIQLIIEPAIRDIGGLDVRRVLPDKRRQRVGPFVFFDHFGPVDFPPGAGINVRPHPHIGLATITYLFDGVIMHRDSLGSAQAITSGAVNWMTAGRGIVHSERSPEDLLQSGSRLHGVQTWVALPLELEETEPRFEHYAADRIPVLEQDGVRMSVIAGSVDGRPSPVQTASRTLFVEIDLPRGARQATPKGHDELAIYVVSGEIRIGASTIRSGTMCVLSETDVVEYTASEASKVILLGGALLPGKRTVWWNFVSSSKERIEQAKRDWREKRFPPVPGDDEFIPLP